MSKISDETLVKLALMMKNSVPSNELYVLGCKLWVALEPEDEDYERLRAYYLKIVKNHDIVTASRLKHIIERRAINGKD